MDALNYRLENIFIRLGSKMCRHVVCIPIGTYYVPCAQDLIVLPIAEISRFLFADVIEAFNSTLSYLDDLHIVGIHYFEQIVSQIISTEKQMRIMLILKPSLWICTCPLYKP